jgi:serine/threonine protein kinase
MACKLALLQPPGLPWLRLLLIMLVCPLSTIPPPPQTRQTAPSAAQRHAAASPLRPPALVTEYLAGGSLRAALSRGAEWLLGAPLAKVKVLLDTARGLDYLHAKRLVHFDLKSANLLLGWRDRVPVAKVADFGLSKQKHSTYVSGTHGWGAEV